MTSDPGTPWPVEYRPDPPPARSVGRRAGRGLAGHPGRSRSRWSGAREGWRRQLRLLAVLVLAGALLAAVWRAVTPATARLGDETEVGAAVDGTITLLGLLAGVLAGGFVLLRPGRWPVQRTVVAVLGSLLGALVAWWVGDQLGSPSLRASGAVLAWPVATATVVFLGALLPGTSSRLQSAGRADVPPTDDEPNLDPDLDGGVSPGRWGPSGPT